MCTGGWSRAAQCSHRLDRALGYLPGRRTRRGSAVQLCLFEASCVGLSAWLVRVTLRLWLSLSLRSGPVVKCHGFFFVEHLWGRICRISRGGALFRHCRALRVRVLVRRRVGLHAKSHCARLSTVTNEGMAKWVDPSVHADRGARSWPSGKRLHSAVVVFSCRCRQARSTSSVD